MSKIRTRTQQLKKTDPDPQPCLLRHLDTDRYKHLSTLKATGARQRRSRSGMRAARAGPAAEYSDSMFFEKMKWVHMNIGVQKDSETLYLRRTVFNILCPCLRICF